MKWCCAGFQGSFEVRDERGLFVFAGPTPGMTTEPSFYIGTRPVDRADSVKLQENLSRLPVPVNLLCRTGLRFCPWCGVELVRFYRDTWRELVDERISREFDAA
jgi:hypothetical protein